VVDTDQNWYRQLAALVLLSGSRAAVEFITNPGARDDATAQLKGALADIDYDALARAVTRAIDDVASTSKDRLSGTIDTLRDRSIDVVGDAKTRAEKQLGAKKGGKKMRFFFGLLIGGLIAYFIFDEQRRDDLLDKLTGASGPIQQTAPSVAYNAADKVQQASDKVQQAAETVQQAAEKTSEKADKVSEKVSEKAAEKA
jgi:hypothetical protein